MYEVVILNSAAKQLRKFDKPVKTKIIDALEKIAQNPFAGERLKVSWKNLVALPLRQNSLPVGSSILAFCRKQAIIRNRWKLKRST